MTTLADRTANTKAALAEIVGALQKIGSERERLAAQARDLERRGLLLEGSLATLVELQAEAAKPAAPAEAKAPPPVASPLIPPAAGGGARFTPEEIARLAASAEPEAREMAKILGATLNLKREAP
jgi:hypothetical protein